GVVAVNRECGRLDSGFFAGLVVVHFGFEALALGPAQIHTQKHVGPVLRLGAAGAGMDGDDGVARVVIAGKQSFSFDAIDQFAEGVEFALQVGSYIFAFFAEIKIGGDVAGTAGQVAFERQNAFEALAFAHDLLGFCLVRPEAGVGGLLFDFD